MWYENMENVFSNKNVSIEKSNSRKYDAIKIRKNHLII